MANPYAVDEDLEDDDLSVDPSVFDGTAAGVDPKAGALRTLADSYAVQGKTAADSLGKRYDGYAEFIKNQRSGMSKKERIVQALAAFGAPTRGGGFGEALSQGARSLVESGAANRSEEREREAMLAKLAFERDGKIADLQAKYGIAGLGAQTKLAIAGAKSERPVNIYNTTDSLGRNIQVRTYADGGMETYEVKTGKLIASTRTSGGTGTASAPGALAGAGGAAPGTMAAPGGAGPAAAAPSGAGFKGSDGQMHAIGETFTGSDGLQYVMGDGGVPKKVGEMSIEDAGNLEARKAQGKDRAEALANLPKATATITRTLDVIDEMLGDGMKSGLSAMIGLPNPFLGNLGTDKEGKARVIPGSPGADFNALAEQLGGTLFLEAYNTLKGGGQIANTEGEKATQAMAALKASQTEVQFRRHLADLKTHIVRGFAAAQAHARGEDLTGASGPSGGKIDLNQFLVK